MSRTSPLLLLLSALLSVVCMAARASDLGTAGPFRNVGGMFCAGSAAPSTPGCQEPPIDAAAPPRIRSAALVKRALWLFDQARLTEARAALGEAIALDPANAATLTLRGRLLTTEGDEAAAAADINAALRLAPDDPTILASKAFLERTDPCCLATALADASRAVAMRPDDVDMRWIRSMLWMRANRSREAFDDLAAALAAHPDDDRIRRHRAKLRLETKDNSGAVQDAAVLLARNERDIDALQIRVAANLARGRDGDALPDLDALVGPAPEAASRRAAGLFQPLIVERIGVLLRLKRGPDAQKAIDALVGEGNLRSVLRLQVALFNNGYPAVAIDGKRSAKFETALASCLAERRCGQRLAF